MNDRPRAPELDQSFAWLNTDRPLTFAKELQGQVVLLDFWMPSNCRRSLKVRPTFTSKSRSPTATKVKESAFPRIQAGGFP